MVFFFYHNRPNDEQNYISLAGKISTVNVVLAQTTLNATL